MATKKEKTLLVIGNGFDLAHGLKTKYPDFLDFFNKKFSNIEITEHFFDIGEINQFRKIIQASIDSKNDETLYKNLELYMQAPFGNFWIAYFNKILTDRESRIGEGWVDFEREIERVISQLEKLLLHSVDFDKDDSILKEVMGDYFNKSAEIVTQEFIPKLNWDLKVLTLFLEFYLIEEKNNFTVCASFKKFFQRIKYKLGNDYRNILPIKMDISNRWQLVFYGHSLDSTDKSSLKWLLNKAEDFPVKIYYYDDDDYNQQIANAIQLIEKEQLIKDVNAGRIVFLPMNS